MANEGWRYEPARHSLAAKGIETTGLMTNIKMKENQFATDYDGTLIIRTPNTDPSILSIGTPEYKEMVHELIVKHNSGKYRAHRFGYIVFPNEEEAHLWLSEWTGQISDGKYENSRLNWEAYRDLAVYVNPDATEAKLFVSQPHIFRRGLKFTDLLWLFSKDHASDPTDVRSIFSKVPTKKIKEYTTDIQDALRTPVMVSDSAIEPKKVPENVNPEWDEKPKSKSAFMGSVDDDDAGSETWA